MKLSDSSKIAGMRPTVPSNTTEKLSRKIKRVRRPQHPTAGVRIQNKSSKMLSTHFLVGFIRKQAWGKLEKGREQAHQLFRFQTKSYSKQLMKKPVLASRRQYSLRSNSFRTNSHTGLASGYERDEQTTDKNSNGKILLLDIVFLTLIWIWYIAL